MSSSVTQSSDSDTIVKTNLLFVVRDNNAESLNYTLSPTTGVAQSTAMLVSALKEQGLSVESATVSNVADFDYVIAMYNPINVIVETLWISTEDFKTLVTKYPNVVWIVRDHSESCFRVLEQDAFGRMLDYFGLGIEVMSNSLRSMVDVTTIALGSGYDESLASYGPNVYPVPDRSQIVPHTRSPLTVNIGCFGAVRLMKNHITQAIAAIMFAQKTGLYLRFHINSYDIPGYVDPVLNNLRELFAGVKNATLVEHGWMSHDDFLTLLNTIDIGTQVSFTETFNIVAADAMSRSVPLITSRELPWIGEYAHRDTVNSLDIAEGFYEIWMESPIQQKIRLLRQRRDMQLYCDTAIQLWVSRFG